LPIQYGPTATGESSVRASTGQNPLDLVGRPANGVRSSGRLSAELESLSKKLHAQSTLLRLPRKRSKLRAFCFALRTHHLHASAARCSMLGADRSVSHQTKSPVFGG